MKPELYFVIPGHAVPSERVRKIPYVKGRKPGGGIALGVRGVTPGASLAFMERVAYMARSAAASKSPVWGAVFEQKLPVRVDIKVYRRARRGDFDNYAKNIADGIARAGNVIANDNLVTQALVDISTNKLYDERTVVLVTLAGPDTHEPLWMRIAREYGWSPP